MNEVAFFILSHWSKVKLWAHGYEVFDTEIYPLSLAPGRIYSETPDRGQEPQGPSLWPGCPVWCGPVVSRGVTQELQASS